MVNNYNKFNIGDIVDHVGIYTEGKEDKVGEISCFWQVTPGNFTENAVACYEIGGEYSNKSKKVIFEDRDYSIKTGYGKLVVVDVMRQGGNYYYAMIPLDKLQDKDFADSFIGNSKSYYKHCKIFNEKSITKTYNVENISNFKYFDDESFMYRDKIIDLNNCMNLDQFKGILSDITDNIKTYPKLTKTELSKITSEIKNSKKRIESMRLEIVDEFKNEFLEFLNDFTYDNKKDGLLRVVDEKNSVSIEQLHAYCLNKTLKLSELNLNGECLEKINTYSQKVAKTLKLFEADYINTEYKNKIDISLSNMYEYINSSDELKEKYVKLVDNFAESIYEFSGIASITSINSILDENEKNEYFKTVLLKIKEDDSSLKKYIDDIKNFEAEYLCSLAGNIKELDLWLVGEFKEIIMKVKEELKEKLKDISDLNMVLGFTNEIAQATTDVKELDLDLSNKVNKLLLSYSKDSLEVNLNKKYTMFFITKKTQLRNMLLKHISNIAYNDKKLYDYLVGYHNELSKEKDELRLTSYQKISLSSKNSYEKCYKSNSSKRNVWQW